MRGKKYLLTNTGIRLFRLGKKSLLQHHYLQITFVEGETGYLLMKAGHPSIPDCCVR